ncbi:MAG: thiosulfate oxidation carrier protein SoxY [Alphaproteobacteria bacterium]|nr:thiosulfate oxidation carrier protein SoxY [Alphaproteobacteria bacterium]
MSNHHRPTIGRRRALVRAGGFGLAAILGAVAAREASATPESARDWLSALAKGEFKEGKVTIRAPEIAENGNAVPVTVSVDSEMTDGSYVKAIYVAADGNPNPGVAAFEFTPASGKAEVQLRIRMAQTQKVVAVAHMNDGSLFTASREVKVTIGGCGG